MKIPIATKLIPTIPRTSSTGSVAQALEAKHKRVSNWAQIQATADPKLHGEKCEVVVGWDKYGSKSYPRLAWSILCYVEITLFTDKVIIKETESKVSVKIPNGWAIKVTRAGETRSDHDSVCFSKNECSIRVTALDDFKQLPAILKRRLKESKEAAASREKMLNMLIRKLNLVKYNGRELRLAPVADVFSGALGALDTKWGKDLCKLVGQYNWATNAVAIAPTVVPFLTLLFKVARLNNGEEPLVAQQLEEAKSELKKAQEELKAIKAARLAPIAAAPALNSALALN